MGDKIDREQFETIVIGAGIVGCSIAYHLAELGHTDVLVIDRGSIDAPLGSTGHAPGLLARNSASPTMARFASYTADIFSEIPTDNPALTRVGSIEVARDDKRMAELEAKNQCAEHNDIDAHLVSVDEISNLLPYMNTSSLTGGLLVPGDGTVDAYRATQTMRNTANNKGITFRDRTSVTGFKIRDKRIVGVVTQNGSIFGARVVVAVGIWGAALLEQLNLTLPLIPVQHPYVYTEPTDILSNITTEKPRPFVRDLDHIFYLREHGDHFGYGWYKHSSCSIDMNNISKAELPFPENGFFDTINYDLFSFLKTLPLSKSLNGIFSMTPDGAPLLGPVPEYPGLWLAEAIWVTHSGGVGKAMAEILMEQTPSFDIAMFNPQRFDAMSLQAREHAALSLYNNIYHWPTDEPGARLSAETA